MHSISIPAGSTSVSVYVEVVDVSGAGNGGPTPGFDATSLPKVTYLRPGSALANANTSDLATAATAWTSGGMIWVSGGAYRIDVPNAALAAGVDRVLVSLVDSIGSPTVAGTVNIELANVTTDFAGSAARRVAAR